MREVHFSDLPDWQRDNHLSAFSTFCITARRMVDKPYKTRGLGVDSDVLCQVASRALDLESEINDGDSARLFFESHFVPHRLESQGFLTGYFQPKVMGSLHRTPRFSYPLYGVPVELRRDETGYTFPHDRSAIQSGALANRDLEIAYVENAVEAFFIHVQGSVHLELENGTDLYLTFAGKTGHEYTSLGRVLCERLNKKPSNITADFLREWMLDLLHRQPMALDEFLAHNRSYIFFKESVEGAIGAAKVPLTPHRSLAIDRTLHTFGTPIWLSLHSALPTQEGEIRSCLLVAQDTGSAIIGEARGDIFMGTGEAAGLFAGRTRHHCDFFVLSPKKEL